MSYRYVDEEDAERATTFQGTILEEMQYDGRTPLDKTIDRIGMGTSSFSLLYTPTDARPSRELSMETVIALWFW